MTSTISLISVASNEITIGQPLRWALYDDQRNVLMNRGEVIGDALQLQDLLARNPLRELSWIPSRDQASQNQSDGMDTGADPDKALESNYTFLDMKLRVGDRIQLQLPAAMGPERHIVKLIGYVENASVLVTLPLSKGFRVQVREGENVVARVFASQTAFGFDCTIERVCKLPYDYLHLSYPEIVQGAVIRKSPRIKTRIISSVARVDAADGEERQAAIIVNLSADGAMVCARQRLEEKSGQISLSFRINLHDVDAHLTVKAVVRSMFIDDDKDDADHMKYQHGIQFLDLQPTDVMILQSLIYQQMIERPNTIT